MFTTDMTPNWLPAIDRASSWFTFSRITLPLVAPLLLIALIFRTMEAFKRLFDE